MTAQAVDDRKSIQKSLREKIRRAAAKAVAEEDVWSKHNIQAIPAERVIRYEYNVETRLFSQEMTIVKIEKEPFTNGAMRHCFRMKKLATPPQSASNHRFHCYGWSRALNYVAKCYMNQGEIDISTDGKDSVLTDIRLQYEAMHWANKFNDINPPKKIDFIRAYAVEFIDRPGKPMFAVERFIAGKDSYGLGFIKHNTNSGFVDLEVRRKTPQVFSAHSFYSSEGTRLVADIQGVGDLYTDPQILSLDYRFGDGDLGPRGMALFFKAFRHSDLSDQLGIPIFPLSRNEKKHQAKYSDDESTLSEYSSTYNEEIKCRFRRLDANRIQRKSVLMRPIDVRTDVVDTLKRSNISDMSKSIRQSIRQYAMSNSTTIRRSKSDVDEITSNLAMGLIDTVFDHNAFHRFESGDIKPRHMRSLDHEDSNEDMGSNQVRGRHKRGTVLPKKAQPPMTITEVTKLNLGKIHYHLACLHGADRFPDMAPSTGESLEDRPSHCISSVIFHLCCAASLRDSSACLALARSRIGLDSFVSPLLKSNVPIDIDSSKEFCKRAMSSKDSFAPPKIAAGCLLYHIIDDEDIAADVEKMSVLEQTLTLMKQSADEDENVDANNHPTSVLRFTPGDKVEGNYCMEGTFYSGVVLEISDDGNSVVVQYDDDGTTEKLSLDNVRSCDPVPTNLTNGTARLSDDEALGIVNTDEQLLFEEYDLMAKLAELHANAGHLSKASTLYREAADKAMDAGKMKTANSWSMRAAELEE